MANLHLNLNQSLELRITEFKNDPDKMRDVNEFLNELLEKAQKEVEKRHGKPKGKLTAQRKSEPGPAEHVHQLGRLLLGYLPQYATAQIPFGPQSLTEVTTNT